MSYRVDPSPVETIAPPMEVMYGTTDQWFVEYGKCDKKKPLDLD